MRVIARWDATQGMSDNRQNRSDHVQHVSLVMRLAAGAWFGIFFFIPALLYFIHEKSAFSPLWSEQFVLAVLLPSAITGLLGSQMGGKILIAPTHNTALMATLRGFGIAGISYPLLITFVAAYRSLGSYRGIFSEFVSFLFYSLLVSTPVTLPVMIIIGSVSGWLLHCLRKLLVSVT
jgi:phosphotransferase system  glucose/maltose/N-acetylglucosamine-specific IIC component